MILQNVKTHIFWKFCALIGSINLQFWNKTRFFVVFILALIFYFWFMVGWKLGNLLGEEYAKRTTVLNIDIWTGKQSNYGTFNFYVLFPGLSMGHIYLSHSHPIAIYACPIPWDSHYIIKILIWNTIQLKLLNLLKFRFSIYQGCGVGSPVIRLRAISIIRLQLPLRLRADSDLQLY